MPQNVNDLLQAIYHLRFFRYSKEQLYPSHIFSRRELPIHHLTTKWSVRSNLNFVKIRNLKVLVLQTIGLDNPLFYNTPSMCRFLTRTG